MTKKAKRSRPPKEAWEKIPTALTRLQVNKEVRVFGPVEKCIYCESTSYLPEGGNLATEHIIPEALDGQLLLREASCRACEKMTNGFEDRFLRSLRGIRYVAGIKGKKRSTPRPSSLPLTTETGSVNVPVEDYPSTAFFPVIPRARILRGDGSDKGQLRLIYRKEHGLHNHGIDNFQVTFDQHDRDSFYRSIAKIAHAYTVSKFGLSTFEPLLLPLIKGETKDYQEYIGGTEVRGSSAPLWDLKPSPVFHEDAMFWTVYLQIFGGYGAPAYEIVTGRFSAEQGHDEAMIAALEALQRR